jgi:formate dehydrogenase assembly factor FdhD
MGRVTVRRPVLRLTADGERRRPDALAGEEPLELRVDGEPLAVTMRTPGADVELALAVELAAEAGVTLVGFLRGTTMNVYARADRIEREGR